MASALSTISYVLVTTLRAPFPRLTCCCQLKEEDNFVIATARDVSAKSLQELTAKYPKTRLALVELNVTDVASIKKAAEEVATLLPNGLDYLINNAGIMPQPMTSFEDLCVPLY